MSHTEIEEFMIAGKGLLQMNNKNNWRGIFATRT